MSDIILWESHYISTKRDIIVGDNLDNVFGYQLILRGVKSDKEQYYGYCKVKLYPKILVIGEHTYKFNYNPTKSVSTALIESRGVIEINWKTSELKIPVLNVEELYVEGILQKVICLLENYIIEEYLPEIILKVNQANG